VAFEIHGSVRASNESRWSVTDLLKRSPSLKAVAPLTRLVAALDRYHGLAAAKAHRRPAPAAPLPAPPAPPLALPAPPLAQAGVDEPLRE
jgi:hypothetical protein